MNITIETAASFLPRIRSTFLAAVLAVGVTMVFGFGANQAHAELTAEALNGLAVISEGLDKIKDAQDAHIIAPNDQVTLDHERQIKETREAIEAALVAIAASADRRDRRPDRRDRGGDRRVGHGHRRHRQEDRRDGRDLGDYRLCH